MRSHSADTASKRCQRLACSARRFSSVSSSSPTRSSRFAIVRDAFSLKRDRFARMPLSVFELGLGTAKLRLELRDTSCQLPVRLALTRPRELGLDISYRAILHVRGYAELSLEPLNLGCLLRGHPLHLAALASADRPPVPETPPLVAPTRRASAAAAPPLSAAQPSGGVPLAHTLLGVVVIRLPGRLLDVRRPLTSLAK